MAGFLTDYFRWHYTTAFADMRHVAKNFFRAITELFSLKLLFQTFFQPMYRIKETYSGGWNLQALFSAILINVLMRIVGIVVRCAFILVASVVFIIFFFLVFLGYVFWVFAPLIGIGALGLGLFFLFP